MIFPRHGRIVGSARACRNSAEQVSATGSGPAGDIAPALLHHQRREAAFTTVSRQRSYVFVSYAREDAQGVCEEIAWLHDQGLNIWYDQHIGAGAAWQDTVADQIIVFADLRRFGRFQRDHAVADFEALLLRYDLLNHEICNAFGGTVRHFGGDDCCLTFPQIEQALGGVRQLLRRWHGFLAETGYDVPLAVGISSGDLMMFRSFVFGTDTAQRLCGRIRQEGDSGSRVLIASRLARALPEEPLTALPDEAG